jgi:hypothetical protein
MYVPVFGKTVTVSKFPGFAIAIGSIVPFVERCFITKITREKENAIYVTHQPTTDCNGR